MRFEPRGGDWPLEPFELRDPELVTLCDVFELAFDRPANFSFRRHGDRLRRILARFDRFSGDGGRRGAGADFARSLVQEVGKDAKWRVRSAAKINSLAWFLPILDEASKDQRRHWKRHKAPRWA